MSSTRPAPRTATRSCTRNRTGTESLNGAQVTPGTFEFFGLPALHGRVLQPDDYEPGAPPVFVMRHKTWVERFGGDLSILNETLVLNGSPRTLVGIMPPRFGWYAADVFIPTKLSRDATRSGIPQEFWFLLGRLKPGVSIEQAKAELTVIAQRRAKIDPQKYPQQFAVHVGTLGDSVVARIKPTLYTVLAAVGLLLLIACSNVANLMLARATTREKEFAVRTVLGAGRMRIVRLLIVESLMLAVAGAGLGIFFAWGGLKALVAGLPVRVIPSETVIELNGPVLAVTLGIAVLTALICGLAPAWQSYRRDLSDPLRDSGKGVSGGFRGGRLRDLVVVMEVALSLTLLIGAGLLMRSFVALREVRLGVQADHVFTAVLQLPADRYATAEQVSAFMHPLLARIRALPGVVHAGASTSGALDTGRESRLEIAGKPQDAASQTFFQQATEDHFRTMRFEFKQGRPLSEADVIDRRKVAVVNDAFVRKYLLNERPIGQRVRLVDLETAPEPVQDAWFEIIGVVGDVRNRGLRSPIEPEVWIPSTMTASSLQVLNVRTSQDPLMLTNAVQRAVSATDADVPLGISGRLEDFADQGMYAGPRFGFLLMMVFGCVGLMLVTVGVYSVLAYSTTRKTHEIGIRMALGAKVADVLGMVVGNGVQARGRRHRRWYRDESAARADDRGPARRREVIRSADTCRDDVIARRDRGDRLLDSGAPSRASRSHDRVALRIGANRAIDAHRGTGRIILSDRANTKRFPAGLRGGDQDRCGELRLLRHRRRHAGKPSQHRMPRTFARHRSNATNSSPCSSECSTSCYDQHAQLTVNLERSPRLVPSGTDLWAEWREDGATITQVRDHSDAARAGLRPGAVVVRFDGMPIGDAVEAAPLALWNCPQAISSPAGGRRWTPPRFDLVSATFASTIRFRRAGDRLPETHAALRRKQ